MASPSVSSRSRLISTYYDTPDLALKRRGLSLRVREQDSRFIQTVKMAGVGGGDLLSRGEWEDELAENSPDPEASQSGGHLPEGIAEKLRPLFETDVTRTSVAIEPAPATRIAAAIDEGEIRAAGPFLAIMRGLGRPAALSAWLAIFAPARKAKAGFNENGGAGSSFTAFCIAIEGIHWPDFPGSLSAIRAKCLPG